MRKFQLRVSGARVGDAARPTAATERPRMTKQLGLRVHSSPLALARLAPLTPTAPLAREDYATADDYEVIK